MLMNNTGKFMDSIILKFISLIIWYINIYTLTHTHVFIYEINALHSHRNEKMNKLRWKYNYQGYDCDLWTCTKKWYWSWLTNLMLYITTNLTSIMCMSFWLFIQLSLPYSLYKFRHHKHKKKIIHKIITCLFWSSFDFFSYCKLSVPDRVCDGKIVQIFSVYYTTTDVMTQTFLWCHSPGTKSSPEKYILES